MNEKLDSYECGVPPISSSREKINVHFYMVAIVFMLFDIEMLFLVPWAVHSNILGKNAFLEILIFAAVLLLGWVYIIKRGVLKWE
ncbi:MAG: NADH-quinone oxidoreductase subunit A [Planctomycetes bacterium]|nr:NADH-quinone oxidoreductase subunit A [Planctomycetota bacterium]